MMSAPSGIIVCTVCCDGDIDEPATAYCINCEEFYCQKCAEYHAKIPAFRQHKMSSGDLNGFKNTQREVGLNCEIHKNYPVTVYCEAHGCVACDLCKITAHKECNEITSLSLVAKGVYDSEEYQDTITKYDRLINSFLKTKQDFTTSLKQLQRQKTELMSSVLDFRLFVISRLDELETQIHEEIQDIYTSEKSRIDNQIESCDSALPCLYKSRSMLTTSDIQPEAVFINLKKASRQRERFESVLDSIMEELTTVIWEFEGDEHLCGSLYSLGKINTTTCSDRLPGKLLRKRSGSVTSISSASSIDSTRSMNIKHRMSKDRILTFSTDTSSSSANKAAPEELPPNTAVSDSAIIGLEPPTNKTIPLTDLAETGGSQNGTSSSREVKPYSFVDDQAPLTEQELWSVISKNGGPAACRYNVRMEADHRKCTITGLAFTEGGSLILVDSANKNLKLMDPNHKMSSFLELSSSPADVKYTDKSEVAVLLPNSKIVQFISVGKSLSFSNQIRVPVRSRRLGFGDRKLAIGLETEILIFDIAGKVHKQVGQLGKQEKIFHDIQSVIISKDGTKVFASDSAKGVIGLGIQGEVIFTYTDIYLPRGLSTGPEGYIFVCGYAAVFVMSENGSDVRSLVTRQHGCVKPTAVCYNAKRSTLVHASLGMGDTDNVIAVYKLAQS